MVRNEGKKKERRGKQRDERERKAARWKSLGERKGTKRIEM